MRPYSPSQSTNFMECPINRDLQKAGWVSNVYTYRESALYAGSAANDGMVYWYRHRNDESLTTVVDDAVEVMRFTLKKSLEVVRSLGIAWKDDVSLQLVTLPDRMEKCFRKVFGSDKEDAVRVDLAAVFLRSGPGIVHLLPTVSVLSEGMVALLFVQLYLELEIDGHDLAAVSLHNEIGTAVTILRPPLRLILQDFPRSRDRVIDEHFAEAFLHPVGERHELKGYIILPGDTKTADDFE